MKAISAALALLVSFHAAASTDSFAEQASLNYTFTPDAINDVSLAALQGDQPAEVEELPTESVPAFLEKGHRRLYIQAQYGEEFSSDTHEQALGGVGWETFHDRNISISLELNGLYAWQNFGSDAFGVNLAVLVRWYMYNQPSWSLYADLGIGILISDHDIPDKTSNFNFTPQAGLGISFKVGDEGNRLMLGGRWYHISNANTASHNPGRDSLVGYIGFSMPF